MDKIDTLKVLSILRAAYPGFYKGMTQEDYQDTVNLWLDMFADDPVEIVAAAVKTHIVSDKKGFPPHIGAIKNAILKLTQPKELELNEMEAWGLVRRAIHGSYMEEWSRKFWNGPEDKRNSAQYHFDNLPEIVQRIVGSPAQLAMWNRVDEKEIDTVIQSNFMRSFRARVENEKEYLALPQDVRNIVQGLSGGKRMIGIGERSLYGQEGT